MAKEFDDLESNFRRRARLSVDPLNLQGDSTPGAPPPSLGMTDHLSQAYSPKPALTSFMPLPRPDPRGIHPPDQLTGQFLTTPIPSIIGMNIDQAKWNAFLAAQPRSKNVQQAEPITPLEEAQMTMGQVPIYGRDRPPLPPQQEPNELSMALGYGGVDQYYRPDPKIQAILKTIRRVPSRAYGGPVEPGQPYLVGERGPEVVVPQQPGTVLAQAGASTSPPAAPSGSFPELPKGAKLVEFPPLPEGAKLIEEPSKAERFLSKVTPEGPISGLISLIRTAGQAAQGRRPDLLAEPESAIPEAVQGGTVVSPGIRTVLGRIPRTVPELPEPSRQLTYNPESTAAYEAMRSPMTPEARAGAYAQERALGRTPSSVAEPIQVPPRPGQAPPAPYQSVPTQTVKEFGAVRRGVELRQRLREVAAAAERSQDGVKRLEDALSTDTLNAALSDPAKAASLASWFDVYARAARGQFSPQGKAALNRATTNLNNNLGSELKLEDILPKGM